MGNRRTTWLLAGVAVWVFFARGAVGQEPRLEDPNRRGGEPKQESAGDRPTPPVFQEAPLQILLQRDQNGALVPLPVFAPNENGDLEQHTLSWTDIDRLLDRIADSQSPRVSCQRATVTGTANGGQASVTIELTFLTAPNRWIRAPLGLSNAVVSRLEPAAGGFLEFDEKEGFVLWMPPAAPPADKAKSEDARAEKIEDAADDFMMPMMPSLRQVERTFKLHASLPLTEQGPERRLAMRMPRAPQARLDLLVDMAEAQVSLLRGDAIATHVEAAGTGQTRITTEGSGGELLLGWRPRRAEVPAPAPVLEAQGVIEVELAENEPIACSARLTVRSQSGPFQSFTVKLPPGMRLSPVQNAEYDVSVGEGTNSQAADARVQAVVRLKQPTIEPVTVRLGAYSPPQSGEASFVEVGGFEVVEAVQQSGHVLLISAGNPSVSWVESSNIVQVDQAPPPLGRAQEVAAKFKYFAQPFSLQVKTTPQKTRVRVEPTYVIEVFPDYVNLTANLKYQIQGAPASFVRVDFQGWEVDLVGGDEVVNRELVNRDRLAPLEIPFRQSLSGDVTVRVTARRILEGDRGSLRVPLPSPAADFVLSALVVVAPSDNLELTPIPEQSHGLLPEPPTTVEGLAPSRRTTFFYRTRTGEPQSVFAGDYEVKAGSLTVEVKGEIQLRGRIAAIRQEVAYALAYEPVDRLAIDVPRAIYERGEMQFQFDETPVVPALEAAEAKTGASPAGKAEDRLRLWFEPPTTLGRHVLTVEYAAPLPEVAPQQTAACALPLAVPVLPTSPRGGAKLTANTLRVVYSRPLHVAPDESEWRLRAEPEPDEPTGLEELVLEADRLLRQAPLIVTREQSEQQPGTTIDRLWLQTWMTSRARRDRAALKLIARDRQLRMRLPHGADPDSLIGFVNGRRVAQEHVTVEWSRSQQPELAGRALVTLDLSAFEAPEYAVEIWYGFSSPRERSWKSRLEAPAFLNASWVRQAYWQLVLPPQEHVATSPAGMTPEFRWRRGWFWERRPVLNQRDLERWSGASEQPEPASGNQYLYSSFGQPKTLEVITAPRSAAILALSGGVLVLGLAALRVQRRQRLRGMAQLALAGAVVLMAAALAAPDVALLVAQGAALGAAGLAVAWLAARAAKGAPRRVAISGGASSLRREAGSARSSRRQASRSSFTATTASPGAPADSSK